MFWEQGEMWLSWARDIALWGWGIELFPYIISRTKIFPPI